MADTTNKIVLVVEDDAEISAHMTEKINGKGHDTLSATGAHQAIQVAEQNRPAMILTDLQLPTLKKLLSLLTDHKTLKDMVVAIIDLNQPDLSHLRHKPELKVLADFDHLDQFVRGMAS